MDTRDTVEGLRPGWLDRQISRASQEVDAFEIIDHLYKMGRLGEALTALRELVNRRVPIEHQDGHQAAPEQARESMRSAK